MASRYSIEAVFRAIDKFTAPMSKFTRSTKTFTSVVRRDFARAQRSVNKLGASIKHNLKRFALIGIAAGVAGATLAIKKFITEASKIEDVVAAFQPLVGGVENAKNIVDKLNETAATTPFQLENLSAATKTLLGFGAATQDNIIPILRMLGDTAGGNSEKLNSIALAYGKIQAKGRASMKEINQLINAGVPILNELKEITGLSGIELEKMISSGKLSADIMNKAFQKMTSEGGKFYKGMEIASKTLSGKISTLKDNIDLTAAKIGETLLPIIKPLIDKAIKFTAVIRKWINENKELIQQKVEAFFKGLVNIIKTGIKVFTTIYKILKPFAPIIFGIIAAFMIYKTVLLAAAVVQAIMNVIMLANPIGLIIIAIGILIGLVIIIVTHWKKIVAWLKKVWDAVVQVAKAIWDWLVKAFKGAVEWTKKVGQKFTFFLGPAGAIVSILIEIAKQWDKIVGKFKSGDILGGILAIGGAILSGILAPVQGLLELLSKIPGVGDLAKGGAEKIAEFRSFLTGEEKTPVSPAERSATIREQKTSSGELVIRDETGKAQYKNIKGSPGYKIRLQTSSGFPGGAH